MSHWRVENVIKALWLDFFDQSRKMKNASILGALAPKLMSEFPDKESKHFKDLNTTELGNILDEFDDEDLNIEVENCKFWVYKGLFNFFTIWILYDKADCRQIRSFEVQTWLSLFCIWHKLLSSDEQKFEVKTFVVLFIIIAICFNLVVVGVFIKSKFTPNLILLVNLAIADVLLITNLPTRVLVTFEFYSFLRKNSKDIK